MKTQTTKSLADLYRANPLKACRLAFRRTRNIASRDRIEVINTLLEMHGTEAIRGEWQNGYWGDIVAVYANSGDSYALTVLQVRDDFGGSRFIISTVGDFVERNEKRYGIQ